MRHQQAAAILAFPAGRSPSRRATAGGRKGVVLPLRPGDGPLEVDQAFSATWDELSRLASDAWSWRDPESLARLEACMERLWAEVDREWG